MYGRVCRGRTRGRHRQRWLSVTLRLSGREGGVPALPVLIVLTIVCSFTALQGAAAVGLPHSGGAIGVEVFAGCVVACVVTAALRAVGLVQKGA